MCAAKSNVRFTPESGHWHSHACFKPEADATSDGQTALKKGLLRVQAAKKRARLGLRMTSYFSALIDFVHAHSQYI
ncbi:MAG: hypothetical protein WA778_03965, partial [Pseudolabrys sp.]